MLLRQAVVLNAWLLCIQMTNGSTLTENWEDHVNSFNLDDYVGDVPEGYQYEDEHMSFTPLEVCFKGLVHPAHLHSNTTARSWPTRNQTQTHTHTHTHTGKNNHKITPQNK